MPSVNAEQLKKIAHASPTAEGFFLMISERERFRRITNITYLRREMFHKGMMLDDNDLKRMFKELEDAKVGRLTRNQFHWFYNLRDIGNMGLGDSNVKLAELKAPRRPGPGFKKRAAPAVAAESKPAVKIDTGKIRIERAIGQDYVQIVVPKAMLNKFLKTA